MKLFLRKAVICQDSIQDLVCLWQKMHFLDVAPPLSIGCITSLYEKSLHKQETSSVSSESVFKSIKTTGRNYQIKERKLPIYCVKTEAPKVALTFDAAWGMRTHTG